MKDKNILILFMIVLTNQIGAGALLPILSLYVEGDMAATTVQAMLVVALFYLAQFVAAPLLGRLSDRWGRRPVLIVSQIGTVLAYVVIYFAIPLGSLLEQWQLPQGMSGSLLIMFAARILDGATGGNISVAQAYASDVSTPQNRTYLLGLIGGATGLGYVLGPIFGGLLSLWGVLTPFIGATVITSVTLILTLIFLPEPTKRSAPPPTAASEHFFNKHKRHLILIITFISITAFSALQNIFPLYGVEVIFTADLVTLSPILMVGLMLTFVGMVIAVTQIWLLKPLVARWGEATLVVAGNGALALGAVAVLLSPAPTFVLFSFVPFGVGYALSLTSLQSLISLTGSDQVQGQLIGWLQASASLAYICGPIVAGLLFTHISPQAPFLAAAGLFLSAFLLSFPLRNGSHRCCWRLRLHRSFSSV